MSLKKNRLFSLPIFLLWAAFSIGQNTINTAQKTYQDSTLTTLYKKLELLKTTTDNDSIAKNSLRLIKNYTSKDLKNNYTDALFDLINYCEDIHNPECLIEAYILVGIQFKRKDLYLESLAYYNKAEELSSSREKRDFKWRIYTNKGLLLREILEIELARENYKKSLSYVDSTNSFRKGTSFLNMSSTFEEVKDHDSMVYYGKKAFEILKEYPHRELHFIAAVNNLAYGHIKQNELDKAFKLIADNIDLNKDKKNTNNTFPSYFYNTLGELNQKFKEYDTAIYYYNKSLDTIDNESPPSNIKNLNNLSEIYEIKGDLKLAIKYLRAKEKYLEKFDQIRLKREIARSQFNQVLHKKNKIITKLREENLVTNKKAYNTKLTTLGVGLTSLFIILIFLAIHQKSRLKISYLNEEIGLTRLKSLKSIMNPHFLFNSFNTLQSFILQKNKFEASEHMRQLSQLIRKVLSNSESLYINFNDELEIIETYVDLENKRFDNQFELEKIIDEDLIKLNPRIPSMIIQPHIENAVIHGLECKKIKKLKLSFQKKNNIIQCIIEDNGIGRRKSAELKKAGKRKHLSITSKNTSERISILRKIGYQKTSLKVKDLFDDHNQPNGTKIIINLPIIN
ncbi:tetratricopeptide repeat-containing sensor histidine kinase [Aquimarina megaterium]|uniref:tetratricopeptide repeat-containing sensor histidine kinase n=1 Tax=Aquimarina megaterium TaxID=1443666 RepID=UPI000943E4AC|nr:histidine kinase [Aquimarina megaterium]